MWFRTLFGSLDRRISPSPARKRGQIAAGRHTATRRLRLESLEDRRLLSVSPAVDYPVGLNPQAVAAADFNGDGRLDLATANYSDSTVSVLLGNAGGTFQPAVNFTTGANPLSVAVGDFNTDGKLDLATVNAGDVSVLLGTGTGTFQAPSSMGVDGNPTSVAVGDFNADGKLDLGVTSNVYFSGTPGFWSNFLYYPGTPGYYEGRANVLLGTGAGSFAAPIASYLGYGNHTSAAAADFDGDGNDDFAAVNAEYGSVTVALGASSGAPLGASASFATGWYPQAVTVGDFTGDGILDLATAGQTVDILPGLGDGTFQGVFRQYVDPAAIAVADFNTDGRLDVVTADPSAGQVSVLLGRGDGTLTPPIYHAAGSWPMAVAVGDFNGDGRPDVAAANAGSGNVSVLLNNGSWPALNAPVIIVSDATVTEGNAGTTALTFTVSLSQAYADAMSVDFATADGSATVEGGDYQAKSGTLTFGPGETSKSVTVLVNGDRAIEPSETLYLQLSDPTNAFLGDATGVGTIQDDEPRISISDVTKYEGNGKTTSFTFTVSLLVAYDQAVTVNYSTANGTATAGTDYQSKTESVTFAPGETSKTITVAVVGDRQKESNETFFVNLFGAIGGEFTDSQGLGTIWNDDRASAKGTGSASALAVDAAIEDWMFSGRKKRAR